MPDLPPAVTFASAMTQPSAAAVAAFRDADPFPWTGFTGFIDDPTFERLRREFPSPDLFERHQGIKRRGGQRPHDRLYLGYGHNRYHRGSMTNQPGPGVAMDADLTPGWRAFLAALDSPEYDRFLLAMLGRPHRGKRYCWHMAETGCEVSPHLDTPSKVGTHLFYFNGTDDWDESWGGQTLILADCRNGRRNPDFDDFGRIAGPPILGNRSLLFERTGRSWHGVRPLRCPAGSLRKLFAVIIEA